MISLSSSKQHFLQEKVLSLLVVGQSGYLKHYFITFEDFLILAWYLVIDGQIVFQLESEVPQLKFRLFFTYGYLFLQSIQNLFE
jgi:hypothetical protein